MNDFIGAWRLSRFNGQSDSLDCLITFIDESSVVFEEEFPVEGWGRFWFSYETSPLNDEMVLWPINQGLKGIYDGRNRVIRFALTEERFTILHPNNTFSEYVRYERKTPPPGTDKFPIKR